MNQIITKFPTRTYCASYSNWTAANSSGVYIIERVGDGISIEVAPSKFAIHESLSSMKSASTTSTDRKGWLRNVARQGLKVSKGRGRREGEKEREGEAGDGKESERKENTLLRNPGLGRCKVVRWDLNET